MNKSSALYLNKKIRRQKDTKLQISMKLKEMDSNMLKKKKVKKRKKKMKVQI